MFDIDTFSVVAFVADNQASEDVAILQNPSGSVRADLIGSRMKSEKAVTSTRYKSNPFDASAVLGFCEPPKPDMRRYSFSHERRI